MVMAGDNDHFELEPGRSKTSKTDHLLNDLIVLIFSRRGDPEAFWSILCKCAYNQDTQTTTENSISQSPHFLSHHMLR